LKKRTVMQKLNISLLVFFVQVLLQFPLEANAQIEEARSSPQSIKLIKTRAYERGLPPNLFAELSFKDDNGNGILEALESASLNIKLINRGKGKAQGLTISVEDNLFDSALLFESKSLDVIEAEHSADIFLPIKARIGIKTAEHKLKIMVMEYFGYDMDPAYLVLNTEEYHPPQLSFSGIEIIDAGEGTGAIVEDGLLQAGELVKAKIVVQNIGQSPATNTTYSVVSADNNIYLEKNTGNLGTISSGEVKEFWFTISPNKRVSTEGNLPLYLTVKENAGFGNLENIPLPVSLNQKPPNTEIVTVKPNVETLKKQIARFEFTSKKFTANVGNIINVKTVDESKTKRKNSVAVVFGIENYKELPPAPYAANDADLMKLYFEKRLGVEKVVLYKNEEVSGFVFDDVFNPDNGELQKAMVKGETELFIYYSGHGVPNKTGDETYLFPSDGKVSRLETQGYPLTKFYHNINKLGAKSVTMILDACFSGATRTTEKIKTENLVAMKGVHLKITKPWLLYNNFTVINSSTEDETSLGYDATETGLFTYYFAAALQGKADENNDNKITLGELKKYVTDNVMETSRKISGLQTPEFYGDENTVLVEW